MNPSICRDLFRRARINLVALFRPMLYNMMSSDVTNRTARPYVHFLVRFKRRSSINKAVYPRRFKMFRVFLKLLGTTEEEEEQANEFLKKARQIPEWSQDNLMRDFVH